MKKRYQSITSLPFNISGLMESLGLTAIGDIADAIFVAKRQRVDSDVDAVMNKTLGQGVSIVADYDYNGTTIPFVLIVDFELDDYDTGKLEAKKRYYMGVGIKRVTPSDTCYLEGDGLNDDILEITPDTIRC